MTHTQETIISPPTSKRVTRDLQNTRVSNYKTSCFMLPYLHINIKSLHSYK